MNESPPCIRSKAEVIQTKRKCWEENSCPLIKRAVEEATSLGDNVESERRRVESVVEARTVQTLP